MLANLGLQIFTTPHAISDWSPLKVAVGVAFSSTLHEQTTRLQALRPASISALSTTWDDETIDELAIHTIEDDDLFFTHDQQARLREALRRL